jgi:hypothetical protein
MPTLESKLQELNKTRGAKLAARAANDVAFGEGLGVTLDSFERAKTSALWMLLELRRVYGGDLRDFPVPDSEDGGNNSDWYREDDDSLRRSLLNDFFDSLPRGKECLEHLEAISKAKRGKRAPEPYAGMKSRDLATQHNRWAQRQAAGRKMLRKAISIELMLGRFKDDLPLLRAEIYLVNGRITETPTPIIITDANDPVRFRPISVATFLAINVDDVEEKGGNWEALFSIPEKQTTQEQEPDETEDDNDDIEDCYDVEARLEAVLSYLENDDWFDPDVANRIVKDQLLEKIHAKIFEELPDDQKQQAA